MREILFRGMSNSDIPTWVFGYYYYNSDLKSHRIIIQSGQEIEVQPESVGQFTGLCDRNGVKIFEGDIVQFINGEPSAIYISIPHWYD